MTYISLTAEYVTFYALNFLPVVHILNKFDDLGVSWWIALFILVVQEVMKRQHTLTNQTLTVLPLHISTTEILVENLDVDGISEVIIRNFFEAKLSNNEVIRVTLNEDQTKALVLFMRPFGK